MASIDHVLRFIMLAAAVTMILVALAGCDASARERWPQWRDAWPNPQRQRWYEMRTLDTRNWPSKRGCMRDGCY